MGLRRPSCRGHTVLRLLIWGRLAHDAQGTFLTRLKTVPYCVRGTLRRGTTYYCSNVTETSGSFQADDFVVLAVMSDVAWP